MKIAVAGGTGAVGRHVVDVLRDRGHDSVVLSRAAGIDLTGSDSSASLDAALHSVDAVIDVTSTQTQSAAESIAFFEHVTSTLLEAEKRAGVTHHVALSIVGSDTSQYGYYAGKRRQEQLVEHGGVPFTLLRATQFHEFATQIYGLVRLGPIVLVPRMRSQPVAAREVAERLVDLAVATPAGRATDFAGPRVEWMAPLVKRWAKASGRRGLVIAVPLPGQGGRSMRDGTLLPASTADRGQQTFAEWLETELGPQ